MVDLVPRRMGDIELDDAGMGTSKVWLNSQMLEEFVPNRERVSSDG